MWNFLPDIDRYLLFPITYGGAAKFAWMINLIQSMGKIILFISMVVQLVFKIENKKLPRKILKSKYLGVREEEFLIILIFLCPSLV